MFDISPLFNSFAHQFQFWRLLVIAARSSVTNVRLDKVGRLVLQRWNCNLKIMRFWSRCCQEGGERCASTGNIICNHFGQTVNINAGWCCLWLKHYSCADADYNADDDAVVCDVVAFDCCSIREGFGARRCFAASRTPAPPPHPRSFCLRNPGHL